MKHFFIKKSKILSSFLLILICFPVFSQEKIEQWQRFEISFKQNNKTNDFINLHLSAKFTSKDTSFVVNGFYDGDNTFKIRFMPQETGKWHYTVSSNLKEINNKKGFFECIKASDKNHGIVKVSNTYYFKYADGKNYYPFGTTAYAWTHMGNTLQEETLQSLKASGFNKVRMCVFPKDYNLVKEEPELYPFEIKKTSKDAEGNNVFTWDFEHFNTKFFQHLEKRIANLDALGIEADLILFHPYDKGRWGFDSMSNEVNINYIKYITARLSAYKNVWWSLANEWDYVKAKTVKDWDLLTETVVKNDPYKHLCSIHGATATYYNYSKPEFSHVSVQDEAPVQNAYSSATLRNIYHKPIILDEVGYEGNLESRWGRHSPEFMTHLVWNGLIAGAYVTHGETYKYHENDTIFWAKGGKFRGSSWKRIAFIRQIMEAAPAPLFMSDMSRDLKTASAGEGYYFVYFGTTMQESWLFDLPTKNGDNEKLTSGKKFKVEIIDTWDMTITTFPETFETKTVDSYRVYDKDMKSVRLPLKPYIALRITEIE